jgi:hypothetical protein
LPEAEIMLSGEVWGWTEEESIPEVFKYEESCGREAEKVSGHEHYDVRSIERDSEGRVIQERIIEVKTKIGNDINISFTKEEAETAKKFADKYWVYLVYGIGSRNPTILAIRDPLGRLPFRRRVAIEKREEFVFKP